MKENEQLQFQKPHSISLSRIIDEMKRNFVIKQNVKISLSMKNNEE